MDGLFGENNDEKTALELRFLCIHDEMITRGRATEVGYLLSTDDDHYSRTMVYASKKNVYSKIDLQCSATSHVKSHARLVTVHGVLCHI